MGEEKLLVTPEANFSFFMPVTNLCATQASGYCLMPVSMILKCLTTSRFRVPAIPKDAAPHCCNAHKGCRSCAHGLTPDNALLKEAKARSEGSACTSSSHWQEVHLQKKKNNVSLAIIHRCAVSHPWRLMQQRSTVKIISCCKLQL